MPLTATQKLQAWLKAKKESKDPESLNILDVLASEEKRASHLGEVEN